MEKAFYWYSLAAAQGQSWSQGKLGYMYEQGQGTAQNFEAAMAWYQRAADQGDSQAQFRLGLMYAVGSGAEQDLRKAFDCFNASAQQGFAPAQCMLGNMYECGEGTGQNYLLAAQWYQKAAEQGLTEAQEALEALSAAINSVGSRTWKDAYRELISRSGSEYQFYYISTSIRTERRSCSSTGAIPKQPAWVRCIDFPREMPCSSMSSP
jgi:TPR repeat protein